MRNYGENFYSEDNWPLKEKAYLNRPISLKDQLSYAFGIGVEDGSIESYYYRNSLFSKAYSNPKVGLDIYDSNYSNSIPEKANIYTKRGIRNE